MAIAILQAVRNANRGATTDIIPLGESTGTANATVVSRLHSLLKETFQLMQ